MNKKIFLIALISLIAQSSMAESQSQIGRYMSVENKPSEAQINLLSQIVQVRFPQKVQTIGDAMNYLLRFSGYSLVPQQQMNQSLKITLNKPLPVVDRDFGPMSLKDALITLAGPAFHLEQDLLNRTVDFHLKPQYDKTRHARRKNQ